MQSQINIAPLSQFAQLLRAAELGQRNEIKLPMQQARLLNLALVELLVKVNNDYESMYNALKQTVEISAISVNMDGGDFE
jgi:hypothetical protein